MTSLFEPSQPEEAERSRLLTEFILQELKRLGGIMSFAEFMELALYHPLGYYNAVNFALGRRGDFTTAPEISPLFAQCFAQQCLPILSTLPNGNILEIGAGSGIFACGFLQQLAKANRLPAHYYIYDISPSLRIKQRHFLEANCPELLSRVVWLDALPTDFTGIIIANEVMDALPVHCFEKNKIINERCVSYKNNSFAWETKPAHGELLEKATKIADECGLTEGYVSEISLGLASFIKKISACLQRGVILLADYGYGRREYYHPERRRGTLTCFYQHHHHTDPFVLLGLQDITAHVDFTAVAEAANDTGLEILGYTTQAAFLLANDLLTLAAALEQELDEASQFDLHQAIKTLTLPTEMGEVIKIMGLGRDMPIELAGFTLQDRLRDL